MGAGLWGAMLHISRSPGSVQGLGQRFGQGDGLGAVSWKRWCASPESVNKLESTE